MRPTVIRLIAGGALGIAFSISLTLPGSVAFPDEPPIRQLAAPEAPTTTVLHAAPLVERPTTAQAPARVGVRHVYVPGGGALPATGAARHAQHRSKPSREPVERAPAPLTPLAAPPGAPATEPADEPADSEEPNKADKPKKERPKAERPRKSEKPKKVEKPKKPKDPGSRKKEKPDRKHRDDQGDDGGGGDGEHGDGRGNRRSHG